MNHSAQRIIAEISPTQIRPPMLLVFSCIHPFQVQRIRLSMFIRAEFPVTMPKNSEPFFTVCPVEVVATKAVSHSMRLLPGPGIPCLPGDQLIFMTMSVSVISLLLLEWPHTHWGILLVLSRAIAVKAHSSSTVSIDLFLFPALLWEPSPNSISEFAQIYAQ